MDGPVAKGFENLPALEHLLQLVIGRAVEREAYRAGGVAVR